MGALDRRSIQSQSRISCALCAVARKRESPALDPAFCRPNAQVTHGGADGGAGRIRQQLSLLVVLSASPPTTIQQSQSQHLQSKEAPSKPFPPNQTTTTQSKWAAAATPTAPARAAPALRAPAPAANKLILSPTDLSVPSPASTTMAQHHLGVHHHRLS